MIAANETESECLLWGINQNIVSGSPDFVEAAKGWCKQQRLVKKI